MVDTSAAVAIIFGEPGGQELAAELEGAVSRVMPAAIRVELGICAFVVEARQWPAGQDVVDRFVRDAEVDVMPLDAEQAARALSAWPRYGKGRQPAGLNLGAASPTPSPSRPGTWCCAPARTSLRPTSRWCGRRGDGRRTATTGTGPPAGEPGDPGLRPGPCPVPSRPAGRRCSGGVLDHSEGAGPGVRASGVRRQASGQGAEPTIAPPSPATFGKPGTPEARSPSPARRPGVPPVAGGRARRAS